MKFAALNKQPSDSSSVSTPSSKKGGPTKEAQESACLQLYHTAIRHQQDGQLEQARTLYREVLESEVMEEAEEALAEGRSVQSSMLLKLKFLVYKNLAGIAKEQGDLSAAVDSYIQAASVDTSDITMWYQLSSAASALGNLLLARTALEQALHCNERYWPAIESLCTVLFALQDFSACLRVVAKGLELEPRFPRGIAYLHHIFQECPDLTYQFIELRIYLMTPLAPEYEKYLEEATELRGRRDALCRVTVLQEPIIPPKKLGYFRIFSLGKCLISVYQHCKELSKKKPSFAVRIDLSAIIDGTTEGPLILSPSPTKKPFIAGSPKAIKGVVFSDDPQSSGDEGMGGARREAKRKLSEADYTACLPKRRSTRVKSKRRERQVTHHNYFEMLQQYIPPWLQLTELPEIGDLSPLAKPKDASVESASTKSERQRKLSEVIASTSKLADREMVCELLEKWKNNCGIINLLYQFVLFLASHYNWRWGVTSFPTVRVFLDAYELLHPHLSYPSPFCSPDGPEMEYLRQLAMVALCYVELSVDSLHKRALHFSKKSFETLPTSSSATTLPKCFHECLAFVQFCHGLAEDERAKRVLSLRVSWCLARLKMLQSEIEAATQALGKCKEILEEANRDCDGAGASVVHLCNCSSDQTISLDHVNEKMKSLEQSLSFEQIHQLFESEKHLTIVDKLLPILDQESGTFTEFLIGSERASTKKAGLSYLLQSLLKLNRTQACFQCCTQALLELLHDYKKGNEQWVTALRDAFCVADRCLNEKSIGELLDSCDRRTVKRLVICVLKTMDITIDMADSLLLPLMPVCLPWKMLYTIISSDWRAGREEAVTQTSTDEAVCDLVPMEVDLIPSNSVPSTVHTLVAPPTHAPVTPLTSTSSAVAESTSITMMSGSMTPLTSIPSSVAPPISVPMTSSSVAPPISVPMTSSSVAPPIPVPMTSSSVAPPISVPMTSSSVTPPFSMPVTSSSVAPPICVPMTSSSVAPPISMPMTSSSVTPPNTMPVTSSSVAPPISVPMASSSVTPPISMPMASSSVASPISVPMTSSSVTPPISMPMTSSSVAPPLSVPITSSFVMPLISTSAVSPIATTPVAPPATTATTSPETISKMGQLMPQPLVATDRHHQLSDPLTAESSHDQTPSPVRTQSHQAPSPTGRQPLEQVAPPGEMLTPLTPSTTDRQSSGLTSHSETLTPQLRTPSPTGVPLNSGSPAVPVPLKESNALSPSLPPNSGSPAVPVPLKEPSALSPSLPPNSGSPAVPVPLKESNALSPSLPPNSGSPAVPVPLKESNALSPSLPPNSGSPAVPVPLKEPSALSPSLPPNSGSPAVPVPLKESNALSPSLPPNSGSPAVPVPLKEPSALSPSLPPNSGSPAVPVPLKESNALSPSLRFLKDAHDHLGSMGWCCRDEGCFLQTSVATLRKELRVLTALPQKQREMLLQELEQCYYCLYGHPHKKVKAHGLQDHSSEQVALTWEAALMLIEYYHPSFLPCIDDTKSNQITAELLTLYKRIIDVIPDIGQVVSIEALNGFIDSTTHNLPEPKTPHQHSSLISEVYYLLADDSLKSGDNHKAIRYYLLNLCYFPGRFDSWAGLALARSRKIVERLNMTDFKNGTEKYVQKQAQPTVRCFERAVSLNSKHCYILEKFGFFCYNVQSFTSQIISHPELFTSRDIQQWAESSRKEMLQFAESSFQKALNLEGTKHAEPWICCLMLGKIGHKLGRDLGDSLGHLLQSAKILHRDGAIYPEYIELSAKGHAVEAIEVHYQLHSCALKHLLQEDSSGQKKIDDGELKQISDIVCQARQLPLGQVDYPALWEWVGRVIQDVAGISDGDSISRLAETEKKGAVVQHGGNPETLLSAEAMPGIPVVSRSSENEEKMEQLGSDAGGMISAVAVPSVPVTTEIGDAQPMVAFESEPVTAITQEVLVVTASNQLHADGPPSVCINMPVSDLEAPPLPSPVSLTCEGSSALMPDPVPESKLHGASEEEKMDTHDSHVLETKSDATSSGSEVKQLEVGIAQIGAKEPDLLAAAKEPDLLAAAKEPDLLAAAQDTSMDSLNDCNLKPELQATIATETTIPTKSAAHVTPANQKLLHQCIYGVLICVIRCPDFFKSLYRLASVLHGLGLGKLAKQMLLGPLPQPLLQAQDKLQPLFVLKGNIFTNMWQLPSGEINRPGTFSTHARKNLDILLRVLAGLKDAHSLIFLAQALRSKPEASKQYMRVNERRVMFKKAVKHCVAAVKALSQDTAAITSERLPRLLADAYTTRGLATKVDSPEQSLTKIMDDSLLQLYNAFTASNTQEPGMECEPSMEPSVEPQLEAAIKFCQTKQKTA